MSTFSLSKPNRKLHVGVILISPRMELLDVAPIDMLSGLDASWCKDLPIEQRLKDQGLDIAFHWVNERGEHGGLTSGAQVKVTDSFETCPPLDISLIGAGSMGYNPTEAELAFIRKTADSCSAFLTVCGGVEYAARAGVLDGKRATGPKAMVPGLSQGFPNVKWTQRRWEQDGKFWTSGALINGLDMMREFVEANWGGEGSLGRFLVQLGSAPVRDRDYKDDDFVVEGFAF